MEKENMMYGIIDGVGISFTSPRPIEGDEFTSLEACVKKALEYIEDAEMGVVEIAPVKYYGDDGNGYWGQDMDYNSLVLDASMCSWMVGDGDYATCY